MKSFKKNLRIAAILSTATAVIASTAIAGQGMGQHAGNFRDTLGPQNYHFSVDISEDVFVNSSRFGQVTGGMNYVDDNEDGVCDLVQDTEAFAALGIGAFVDENEDGICDEFQTKNAYNALGMQNFIDIDGDGICDNYERNPITE